MTSTDILIRMTGTQTSTSSGRPPRPSLLKSLKMDAFAFADTTREICDAPGSMFMRKKALAWVAL